MASLFDRFLKTPGRIVLCRVRFDGSVFFYKLNSKVLAQFFGISFTHLERREPIERMLVDMFQFAAIPSRPYRSLHAKRSNRRLFFTDDRIVKHDDVIVLNLICFAK